MRQSVAREFTPYTEMHPNIKASRFGIMAWPIKCFKCNTTSQCAGIHLFGEVSEFEPIDLQDTPDYVAELTDPEYDRWSESLQGSQWGTYPVSTDIEGDDSLSVLDNISWVDTRVMAVIQDLGFSWRYRVSGTYHEPPTGAVSIVNACKSCGGDLGMISALLGGTTPEQIQLINVDDANITDSEFRANLSLLFC